MKLAMTSWPTRGMVIEPQPAAQSCDPTSRSRRPRDPRKQTTNGAVLVYPSFAIATGVCVSAF